jgi:hypothetical protein
MFEIIDTNWSKFDPWSLERSFLLPVERVLIETHTHGLFVGYESTPSRVPACHQCRLSKMIWIRLSTLMRIQIRLSKWCGFGSKEHCMSKTLQMKGWLESNINVWFQFMYSQKWNCAASLFPQQNYNFLSPNFRIHVSVSELYIPTIGLPRTDRGNI